METADHREEYYTVSSLYYPGKAWKNKYRWALKVVCAALLLWSFGVFEWCQGFDVGAVTMYAELSHKVPATPHLPVQGAEKL